MADSRSKPAHELRIGMVKAAIWRNDTQSGIRFNVTFERLYKEEKKGWQGSHSFGYKDLLVLGKLANQAHSWITAQGKPSREAA